MEKVSWDIGHHPAPAPWSSSPLTLNPSWSLDQHPQVLIRIDQGRFQEQVARPEMGYLDQLKHQNNVAMRKRYTCPQEAANWNSIHYVYTYSFLREVLWSIWTSETSIAFALCFCTLTQRCFGNPTLVWEARLRRWFTAPLNSCSIIWNIARQRKLYIFIFWLSYVVVCGWNFAGYG